MKLAQPYCRRVLSGDLNEIAKMELAGEYDIVIAADVLEHLVRPEFVLSKLKACLKRNGLLVVSLPNVANLYVRLNLLIGRFPYHTKGILDRTHLRHYTLSTARKMLRKTGWVVEAGDVAAIPFVIVIPLMTRMPFRLLLYLFYGLTRLFKGVLAYQSIFYCRNPNLSRLL